jgi:soluble lytic murein transglycosylase-like protein
VLLRRISVSTLGVAILVCLAAPRPQAASASTLYSYVDDQGVIHFTDAPTDPRFVRVRRSTPPRRYTPRVRSFDPLIEQTARHHGVPPALVKAVIAAESSFDPRAVSPKGAQGLMQLMPETARSLGVRNPMQADENVRGGVRYLRALLDRYRDWTRALAAYNAGPAAVDRYGGMPPFRETREYVDQVLTYYRRYHGDFTR